MKKTGAGLTLPDFLQKTEKYPAFIVNIKNKIVADNNFFKKICNIHTDKPLHVKDVFKGPGLASFITNSQQLSEKQVISFETEVNSLVIVWEMTRLEEIEPHFLCVGAVEYVRPAGNIPLPENHFSAFMNNSPALMWATNTEGRIVIMNKKYKQETGFSDDDSGKFLWEVFPRELADRFKKNDEIVIERGGLVEMEETSIDKFGHKREYLVYKFPLQTTGYGLVVAGWSVDITEHKNANKQLLHQNNRFRQIARLQSHAVRRPLANILGLIDLIQYYAANDDFAEVNAMVKLLKDSGNDLDDIIKKIVNKAGVFHPNLQTSVRAER